ncbi:hypothetical protein F5Y16DRAFT_167136 [Xylariaceae sp. FL0255]|nr:hypothetical protein F5Y16DRAFT_167136 [Xylariaceae sp. FL0255]
MTSPRVPFDQSCDCFTDDLSLPATYQRSASSILSSDGGGRSGSDLSRVDDDRRAFFADDLNLSRLNLIHSYLWLAGLERPARPLHQQIAIGRVIILTESADLHLLWKGNRIYIKPLPEYLLSYSAWEKTIVGDRNLNELASGFLLSYLWLISHRSDLTVAHQCGLLPEFVTWRMWTELARSASQGLDIFNLTGINIRFRHGELRLARIDWIYRLSAPTRNITNLLRGYRSGHHRLESFVASKFTPIASAFAYVVLVLTAMQVGLATTALGTSTAFQNISYGFTVFSILAPVFVLITLFITVVIALLFNLNYTVAHRKTWVSTAAFETAHSSRKGRTQH